MTPQEEEDAKPRCRKIFDWDGWGPQRCSRPKGHPPREVDLSNPLDDGKFNLEGHCTDWEWCDRNNGGDGL